MIGLGKVLLSFGLVATLVGVALILAGRLGLPLGRLPGDFAFRGRHVSVYLPLGTSLLLSVVLSVLFYLLSRLHR